ncbi:MAG: SNF2 helicase associated domain-containing protein [Lachnospiraceae bacterium]|nr:SNF2 helicase associated domain-containing protein [Lachnospiraceae bacterium]
MKITDWKVSTFWKGELGIRATVAEDEAEYKVSLYIKGSQVYDYSCSCINGSSYKGMCRHANAVFAAWKEQQASGGGKSVSTSQEIRTMIREYTNREVAQIIQEGEETKVRLVPRLMLQRGEIRLEFRVGRDRLYVLKDLTAFVQAIESGAMVSYGKQLNFHHSVAAFVEEDRPLCALLVELVNVYQEHYEQFRRSSYVTVQGLRELNLSRANRDRFFRLMEGRELELEDNAGTRHLVTVKREPLRLSVTITKAGKDGIRVALDSGLYGFSGEEHWYVGDRERLVCLDQADSMCLNVFLEETLRDKKSHTLEVQERDIPLFYERVLKKILPYCDLDANEVNLEAYRPQELKATFTFDSSRPGELTMRPELSYGEYSFQPMEDEKVPRTICRDVPGEFRISQLITRYFKYRDETSEYLVIRDDDDALYRLLSEGMAEFMELGAVYMSDAAKAIRILPPARVSVGVRSESSWLELTVDVEGMEPSALQKILTEYDPKKPYYRLKSGEFLRLDESGLVTVAKLVDGLAISKAKLSEDSIRIPAYRALYLDSVLKEGNGITFYRDHLFKAVVRGMKSVEDSDYEIPSSLLSILRGYQKAGFRWLKTLDAYGFGGILADDMGLGKTIQVIAVLLDEAKRAPESGSLIVCPASLVYNWENELHTFAPELTVTTVVGTAAEREAILAAQERSQVLITSYDLLKRDIQFYQDREFRFQIIDEAQYIKNPGTQSAKAVKLIQARTRYALTGTPIENRLSELWSIFDYLMPGFLFTYSRFKKDFELPIVREGEVKALKLLHRMSGPFVLRRLKQDVLKELPDKLETVVYSRAEAEQKELYTAHALQLKEQLKSMSGAAVGSDKMQILAQLTRLRQLCCDPTLCFGSYKGGSAKLDTCVELIAGGIEGGHKILLFSQFASMLELIGKRLKKEGIAYHMLTGSTSKEERIQMVGAFQSDEVPVFLISLKAGGTGLNLTAADIVIHYDPWWNVAAQNQATDRAHRIGQEKQVSVFKLIMKDTIEENIVKLQEQKKSLAEQIITEGTVSLGSLTREDLLEILR